MTEEELFLEVMQNFKDMEKLKDEMVKLQVQVAHVAKLAVDLYDVLNIDLKENR